MAASQQWRFGPFLLDATTGCLWRDDELVELAPKPVALLAHLVAHAGQVVSKEMLLDAVWPETVVSEGVLKTNMGLIRRTLGDTVKSTRYIATVRGRGYRFTAPVQLASPPGVVSEAAGASPAVEAIVPVRSRSGLGSGLFVGRGSELARLRRGYEVAQAGDRQIVMVSGEAGIGKTTLLDRFVDELAADGVTWVGHGQCVEQYGAAEPYLPLLEAFARIGRESAEPEFVELLTRHAPSWVAHLPALVAPEALDLLRQRGATTRERMLRELAEAIEALSLHRPLVLVLEDLHWSDASTLNWLSYIARRRDRARLLVLGTYRPLDVMASDHPLRALVLDLPRCGQSAPLALDYLPAIAVADYLAERFQTTQIPANLADHLHRRTNGNPLFLTNVVDDLVRQQHWPGDDSEAWGDLEVVAGAMPESLNALIVRQIEQLSAHTQKVLEAASVVGVEFESAAVAAAIDREVETVEAACAALARQGQFIAPREVSTWPDGTVSERYGFTHAMYQDVLYERVATSRRVRMHNQIGTRMETGFADVTRQVAGELALHFERGRDPRRTLQYLQQAGETASKRSAHQESIGYLTRALEVLDALPDTPERAEQELTLQLALVPPLIASKGYAAPEAERVYARARELCDGAGSPFKLFRVLWASRAFYFLRGEMHAAFDLGRQLLQIAEAQDDIGLQVQAHVSLGPTVFNRGDLPAAQRHLSKALSLYDPQAHADHAYVYGHHPAMAALSYEAMALWVGGCPSQALNKSREALSIAESHPHSLAFALSLAAKLHQFSRDVPRTRARAEALVALSTQHGLSQFLGMGVSFCGWARIEEGEVHAGIEQLKEGLEMWRATGSGLGLTHRLALLAEAYAQIGQVAEGLLALDDALALAEMNGERIHVAELYRLKGELKLQQLNPDEAAAETFFVQALDVARAQQARAWELRAAMSLGRMWRREGKTHDAYALLAPIYQRFTEVNDSADLTDARTLLQEFEVVR